MLVVDRLTASIGTLKLLYGISFSVEPGETLAILGASGSGKSLTGRALLALPPAGVRYGGRVGFRGEDHFGQGEAALARMRGREISMIFQEPATALNPAHRIGLQMDEPLRLHTSLGREERAAHVARMLERTGLADAGVTPARYPHELSGGQRQRVAVAIALALEPALIVADEPTSALDTVSAAKVLDLLFALARDAGSALVIITHDMAVARRSARTLVMDAGRIVEDGATDRILARPSSDAAQSLVSGAVLSLPPRNRGSRGPPVLSARDVSAVRGGNEVVRKVSLAVASGERLALVGRSGSGKSTLARALLGLIPASGRLSLDGERVPLGGTAVRRAAQIVFQDPVTSFNPRHTVSRIVTEPLYGRGVSRKEALSRAEAALASVGLPADALVRKPHAFSGGQRQRIAIARALVGEPKALIADEAVSALDAALRGEVVRLLDDLVRARDVALIFIAHDLALVRSLADRIAVMEAAEIVETGPPSQIFGAPRHPATQALVSASGVDAPVVAAAQP